jgi:RsiW-degrading membrane proteinase PrsW (M82 family)
VASPALLAAVLCVVPATAVLLVMGRRFEGYFDDRRLFFSLVVGFFAGIVVAFLEIWIFRFHNPEFLLAAALAGPLLLLGYGLVESLAKLVVLGSRGFRTRKDTPFYGAALGTGFGALLGLQHVALQVRDQDLLEGGPWGGRIRATLTLLLLGTGFVLTAAAVGARLGKSVVDGKLRSAAFRAALWQSPMPGLHGMYLALVHLEAPGWQVALVAVVAAAYGIGLGIVSLRMLDGIVPPEIRDLVRRERRRARRSA